MTPIYVEKLDLPGIMRAVELAKAEYPTGSLDHGGTWSSAKDLLNHQEKVPDLAKLATRVRELAGDEKPYAIVAWANEIKPGQSIGLHDHVKTTEGPNAFAAIYYVRAGMGTIEFDKVYKPHTGELYFFPADAAHEVPTFDGKESRLRIAFNVRPITER